MVINFYSVLTVSNLSNMLKCVLLFPSDCVYVRYCNEIISIINKIIFSNQGGESSIAWWRNIQVAKRLGGEPSRGRNVLGAKSPGGELTKGRNVQLPNYSLCCQIAFYVVIKHLIVTLTLINCTEFCIDYIKVCAH